MRKHLRLWSGAIVAVYFAVMNLFAHALLTRGILTVPPWKLWAIIVLAALGLTLLCARLGQKIPWTNRLLYWLKAVCLFAVLVALAAIAPMAHALGGIGAVTLLNLLLGLHMFAVLSAQTRRGDSSDPSA